MHFGLIARVSRQALLTGTAIATFPVLLATSAQAQFVWTGATPGQESEYNLGTNWNPTAGAPPFNPGQTATFDSAGSATIVVTGSITPDAWIFNAGAQNYTITGSNVIYSNVLVFQGGTTSISNQLSGFGLSMTGGTLTLNGTNAITTTIMSGGTLKAGSGSAIGSGSALTVGNGNTTSTFDLNGFSNTVASLSGDATGIVTNSGGTAASLTMGSNSSSAFAGVIKDGASTTGLIKQGTGILTLSGQNTYSGATQINGGTLQAGSGTTFSSFSAVTLAAGATLDLNNFSNLIGSLSGASGSSITLGTGILGVGVNVVPTFFAGVISGNGSLLKSGTGALNLTGANTYSGETVITDNGEIGVIAANGLGTSSLSMLGGTLRFLANGINITNSVSVGANGGFNQNTFFVNPGFTATISSNIVNGQAGGVFIKNGPGTLILTGANTYTGATGIFGGTLAAGTNTALGSGIVQFNNAGSALSNANNAHIQLANNVLLDVGSSAVLRSGVGAGTGGDLRMTGVLSGSGALSIEGATPSSVILDGTNTYTGTTTVTSGRLAVNGSIASSPLTTVNAGATLGGTGIVGNTTINGGTLSPGNSIGSLVVQGNLVFTAASSYMVEVSPVGSDRVGVSGTATLGGATVNASFAAGSYITKQYTIVNAAGGVIGTFGSQVNTNLPTNFTSSLSYDANNAYLNLTLNFVPPPSAPNFGSGLSANQQNIANTLVNYFNSNGGIPLAFGALTPVGLTQASGETATGAQQATFDAMTQFMGLMTDPFTESRGAPTNGVTGFAAEDDVLAYANSGRKRSRAERDAFAMFTKAPPRIYEARWNVWAAGFGGSRTTDGNAGLGSNRTTGSIAGGAVGADYWFSPTTVAGFSMAGGATSFSVADGGSGTSDLFQAGGFVRHTIGTAYVTGAAAYGWQNIRTDRLLTAAGGERLRADFNANAWSGRIEVGNRWLMQSLGGVGMTPYAAVQVTAFDLPSYAETSAGGLFALNYAGKTVTDTRSELGLRSDRSFTVNDALLTLRGRAAWAHDFNADRNVQATFQTLPGTSFVVNGAQAARNAALTSASAEMSFVSGLSLAATFEGEFSDTTRSYAGKGVVRYAW